MTFVELYRSECPPDYDPQCVVATLTAIALAAVAVSAGVGAYSAKSSADAQSDAAKYNAAVARNNETTATQQSNFQAERIRDKNRRIIAAGRADLLKSGVTESGSAQDLLLDSSIQGELDTAAAIYTGRISAGNQKAQSTLESSRAGWAQTAGNLGVTSSILGGASSATSIAANPNFRNT